MDDEEDIAVATEYFWDDEEEAGFDESDFSLDSADAKKVGFSFVRRDQMEEGSELAEIEMSDMVLMIKIIETECS